MTMISSFYSLTTVGDVKTKKIHTYYVLAHFIKMIYVVYLSSICHYYICNMTLIYHLILKYHVE